MVVDYGERRVTLGGDPVRLTPTEYRLLSALSMDAGHVLTREQLMLLVWGLDDGEHDPNLLRAFVKNLRLKLGDSVRSPRYIMTEPGVGYRMAPAEEG